MRGAIKWLLAIMLWSVGLAASAQAAVLSGPKTISAGGHARYYYYYKPDNFDPTKGMIVWLHGGGADAVGVSDGGTDGLLRALADKYGVLVVFPEGKPYLNDTSKHNWNDCARDSATTDDKYNNWNDVAFLKAMIAAMPTTVGASNLALNKVYLGGHSDGGLMASRMALEANDVIAAVAVVAGNLPISNDPSGNGYKCGNGVYTTQWTANSGQDVPMILMKGDNDGDIPYGFKDIPDDHTYCQQKDPNPNPPCVNGAVHSWYDTVTFWQWKLRMTGSKSVQKAATSLLNYADTIPANCTNCGITQRDGSTVTRYNYAYGTGPARLVFDRAFGGGHAMWGADPQTTPNYLAVGWKNRDKLNIANPYFAEEIWAFFKQFTLAN